jgi:hypothetical protein
MKTEISVDAPAEPGLAKHTPYMQHVSVGDFLEPVGKDSERGARATVPFLSPPRSIGNF